MNGILLIAHAPLASALRQCALHVFPDCAAGVQAIDVIADEDPEHILGRARQAIGQMNVEGVLLLTDVFGATPCNVALQLNQTERTRLLAGANLPMLLRSVCYRHEALEALSARAQSGGTQGIMPVARAAPQNQPGKIHASGPHHHQQ